MTVLLSRSVVRLVAILHRRHLKSRADNLNGRLEFACEIKGAARATVSYSPCNSLKAVSAILLVSACCSARNLEYD